jgi:hypothetical protein
MSDLGLPDSKPIETSHPKKLRKKTMTYDILENKYEISRPQELIGEGATSIVRVASKKGIDENGPSKLYAVKV